MNNIDEETLSTITSVSKMLAPYFKFGYYDIEDIEQEICVMCLEALKNFDETKASLKTFLVVNAKNRLLNLQRDKLCKLFPPCFTCEHYKGSECEKYESKDNCAIFAKWQKNSANKHKLFYLANFTEEDVSYDTDIVNELYIQGLLQHIDENMPAKYRAHYLQYIHNNKMTGYAKKNIVKIIKRLAEDYLM